jgi:hypothetical protein
MKKCVADYKAIDDGEDIPKHRIQHFRSDSSPINIPWDRLGRVNRWFGSGQGANAEISRVVVLANATQRSWGLRSDLPRKRLFVAKKRPNGELGGGRSRVEDYNSNSAEAVQICKYKIGSLFIVFHGQMSV